tara:strand:+ start:1698 stop:1859 length:162 start_codon:yes stop_codon:yes gene_type:complete
MSAKNKNQKLSKNMGQEYILMISAGITLTFVSLLSYSIYRIKRIENALISMKN